VVVAEKHAEEASDTLPEWWGITTVFVNGKVSFTEVRAPQPNPAVDAATLVRLLWREEAAAALVRLGRHPEPRSSRGALWRQLLDGVPLPELRDLVRRALVARDPAQARIATRRFTPEPHAVAAGL
jgi:hypothetical protein